MVKKAANLSINSDLIKKAKALDINMSAVLEHSLTEVIRQKQAAQWQEENKEAIENYNRHVGDELRSF